MSFESKKPRLFRQVTTGVKKITNTTVPGYSFGYQFDGIGNRESATTNGITDVYTPNSVNQYEQRTVPAYFQVRGIAEAIPVTPPATPLDPEGVAVKLEGAQSPYTAAAFGPANYFGLALPVPAPGNENNALWKGITIQAWANNATNEYQVSETRKDFLPKSPEDYDYDFDGNLIKDGRWTYEWDAENRLIRMTARTADFSGQTLPAGMDVGKLEFKYDWQGRRLIKLVYGQNGTTLLRWTAFLYDGWRLMNDVERYLSNGVYTRVVNRTYYWGPDLSGVSEGAGGVGGLVSLHVSDHDLGTQTATSESWVPAYDGNGNILAYLHLITGETTQEEEYGPFGEPLRSRRTSPLRSPIGWSTKYTDEETGLVYYGYRYYAPLTGRWISRDPIEEADNRNMYVPCSNDVTNHYDILGLWTNPERKGQERAKVSAQCGDTIETLADILRLNADEFQKWLKAEDGVALPDDESQAIDTPRKFSVPNTAYLDRATLRGTAHGPLDAYVSALNQKLANQLRQDGVRVIESDVTDNAGLIISHLKSPNLLMYSYGGHGAEGALIVNSVGRPYQGVSPGKYTDFGIRGMFLTACDSGYKGADSAWRRNVSRKGVLRVVPFPEVNSHDIFMGTNIYRDYNGN